jgi:hypothetical protein
MCVCCSYIVAWYLVTWHNASLLSLTGLGNIHELVSQGNYELRIDVTAANGSKGYETYPNFTISAGSNYTLHILPGHGSIGLNSIIVFIRITEEWS